MRSHTVCYFVHRLDQFHHDIDDFLTDAQRSESFAYRSMISEKLHRVMVRRTRMPDMISTQRVLTRLSYFVHHHRQLYCRWVDPVTYREVTRPQTKKYIPFPLNQFLPKKIHMDTMAALKTFGLATKEQAYVIARDCYTALNAKLASAGTRYFFGDRPSALDVAVFGHIVDALGNAQLGATVHQHAPLLVTLAETLRDAYFSVREQPTSLSAEALAYTENHVNGLGSLASGFMSSVPAPAHVSFLAPYKSLNWGRREVAQDMAHKKRAADAEAQQQTPSVEGFEKGTRNVIIGAVAAILLYAFAALPLEFRFIEGDDDDELDGVDYDDDDDE